MSPVPESEREGKFPHLPHPFRPKAKPETRRFRLLAGGHVGDDGRVHTRGEIVESKLDLVGVFGGEKFQALSHLDEGEDAKHAKALEAEHARHAKVVAEGAARAAADVEAHRDTIPKPLTAEEAAALHQKFTDEKNQAAGLGLTEHEKAKTTAPGVVPQVPMSPTPTSKPPRPVQQKTPHAPAAPKPPVEMTKEQTHAHLSAMSASDLKKLAEDEEVDVSKCKSKDDLVKALMEDE